MQITPFDFCLGKTKRKRKLSSADKKRIAAQQSWKCASCRETLPATYHVDHKKRFSDGGSDKESNLQALCPNCHAHKTENERHKKKQQKLKKKEVRNPVPALLPATPIGSDVSSLLFGKPSKKKKKNEFIFF